MYFNIQYLAVCTHYFPYKSLLLSERQQEPTPSFISFRLLYPIKWTSYIFPCWLVGTVQHLPGPAPPLCHLPLPGPPPWWGEHSCKYMILSLLTSQYKQIIHVNHASTISNASQTFSEACYGEAGGDYCSCKYMILSLLTSQYKQIIQVNYLAM